jgi:hypothetical protein
MKSLREQFLQLDDDARRQVHFCLCKNALSRWQELAASRRTIRYYESVAGTRQEVDKQLPADAFNSATQTKDIANVKDRYVEPIVALQDEDLEFHEQITFAYYAIYNLFRKYVLNADIDDWLIVNQALAAEQHEDTMAMVLETAMKELIEPPAMDGLHESVTQTWQVIWEGTTCMREMGAKNMKLPS